MRVIIQRVKEASVTVNKEVISKINKGLLVLLGITHDDSLEDINWLVNRISTLKYFDSDEKALSKTVAEEQLEVLLVSQFTLFASTKKGARLSFLQAAKPDIAQELYEQFKNSLINRLGERVKTGQFGAYMDVQSINSGPLTLIIDSKNKE